MPFHSPPHAEREDIVAMNKIAFVLTGARAPLARTVLTTLFAGLLAALAVIGAGCSDDETSVTYPKPPLPQSRNWLFDVAGTDAGNIFAAGNKGAMFHYDGSGDVADSNSWEYVDKGTNSAIVTLWETDGTIYAVGHDGTIWRNTGTQWSSMDSGTSEDLFSIGEFNDQIYACGYEGTLRRLNGSSWAAVPSQIVMRDPATQDTTGFLDLNVDMASLLTVSHYFIGGAYKKPEFDGEPVGILGTDGMVLTTDTEYPWLLRPIRGDQLADAEWVLCTTNRPLVLAQNYLGTSEGWIFQLEEDESGALVWVKHYPRITANPGSGIRDVWLDENQILYMVTDDGQLILQSEDYDFDEDEGFRKVIYDQINSIVSIWGTGSDHFFMTTFDENKIFTGSVDWADTTATVTEIPIRWPAKGMGAGIDPFTDELGRPRF
jgi:hypothetical protein